MQVLGIAGSLRRHSWNRHLLAAAAEHCDEHVRLAIYEHLHEVPVFNEDAEAPAAPDGVMRLREAVRRTDGLLIATPEYNQSIPGVLKNAIDWLSRDEDLLLGKPIAVIGATRGIWGTRLAQAALRQTLAATGAQLMSQPMLFVARAHESFDGDGRLSDPPLRSNLSQFMRAFSRWIAIEHR